MNRRTFLTGLLSTAAVVPAVGTSVPETLRLLVAGWDACGNPTTEELVIGCISRMTVVEGNWQQISGIRLQPVPWQDAPAFPSGTAVSISGS